MQWWTIFLLGQKTTENLPWREDGAPRPPATLTPSSPGPAQAEPAPAETDLDRPAALVWQDLLRNQRQRRLMNSSAPEKPKKAKPKYTPTRAQEIRNGWKSLTQDKERKVQLFIPVALWGDLFYWQLMAGSNEIQTHAHMDDDAVIDYLLLAGQGGPGAVTVNESENLSAVQKAWQAGYVLNVDAHSHPGFKTVFSTTDVDNHATIINAPVKSRQPGQMAFVCFTWDEALVRLYEWDEATNVKWNEGPLVLVHPDGQVELPQPITYSSGLWQQSDDELLSRWGGWGYLPANKTPASPAPDDPPDTAVLAYNPKLDRWETRKWDHKRGLWVITIVEDDGPALTIVEDDGPALGPQDILGDLVAAYDAAQFLQAADLAWGLQREDLDRLAILDRPEIELFVDAQTEGLLPMLHRKEGEDPDEYTDAL